MSSCLSSSLRSLENLEKREHISLSFKTTYIDEQAVCEIGVPGTDLVRMLRAVCISVPMKLGGT